MIWPEKPSCHAGESIFAVSHPFHWRPPRERGPEDGSWDHIQFKARTCSYCGSIHPEDLLAYLAERGHTLEIPDMKYGWPHKFYLSGGPIGKFYNAHLLDQGYSPDALAAVVAALAQHTGIRFVVEGQRLLYGRAPTTCAEDGRSIGALDPEGGTK